MKRIVVLGSTGSIGENALRVATALSDRIEVVGLAAQRNVSRLAEQALEFGVRHVAVGDRAALAASRTLLPSGVEVHAGAEGLVELAALDGVDMVLCAVVGLAGLQPVLAAIDAGTDVALATKEVLVGGGEMVTRHCRETGARLLPVDSEHSGVFQALYESSHAAPPFAPDALRGVRRIMLTASGGPFYRHPELDFDTVTAEAALKHPTWSMGPKVTIDSATLMNKGLELIEAHWMFGLPLARIDAVIHPQSIVHALVEFRDGNTVAHLGPPDMRFAIQYALTWPERVPGGLPALDLAGGHALTFDLTDEGRFPCLGLARRAGTEGGTMPAVLNAANEIAVQRFLNGDILFSGIWRLVEAAMDRHAIVKEPSLEEILAADGWARDITRSAEPGARD